jgi:hypothetical protein
MELERGRGDRRSGEVLRQIIYSPFLKTTKPPPHTSLESLHFASRVR